MQATGFVQRHPRAVSRQFLTGYFADNAFVLLGILAWNTASFLPLSPLQARQRGNDHWETGQPVSKPGDVLLDLEGRKRILDMQVYQFWILAAHAALTIAVAVDSNLCHLVHPNELSAVFFPFQHLPQHELCPGIRNTGT